MDALKGDQICLEFSEIDVHVTGETKRGGDTGYGLCKIVRCKMCLCDVKIILLEQLCGSS